MNDDKIKKYCQNHPIYIISCYNCKKDLQISTKSIFSEKDKVKTQPCHSCGWLNPVNPKAIFIKEKIDLI